MALDEAVERARHAGPTPLSIRLRVGDFPFVPYYYYYYYY